jgi:hypothetical protein
MVTTAFDPASPGPLLQPADGPRSVYLEAKHARKKPGRTMCRALVISFYLSKGSLFGNKSVEHETVNYAGYGSFSLSARY